MRLRIIREARALVRKLEMDRVTLVSECERTVFSTVPPSPFTLPSEVDVKFGDCFSVAYEDMLELNKENGCRYDYFEVMQNLEGEGVCKKCIDSYAIKIGPLAEARRVFGNAKRAISVRGKKLITHSE